MPNINKAGIIPSEEVYLFAQHNLLHVEWPIGEDTVLANSLSGVNSLGVNARTGKAVAFDGAPVFIDHVMFSGDTENAFATRHKGRYIVALFSALYMSCLDIAFTIFRTRGALPEVGDHLAEQLASNHYTIGLTTQRFRSPKEFMQHLGANMPRCPVRRDAAHVLASIMLAFVLHHEEGHIVMGHADYAVSARSAAKMSETTKLDSDVLKARALHHLSELDADKWGFLLTLSPLSVKCLSQNYRSLSLTERQWIWLSWVGAALTGALLAMLDRQNITDPLAWADHPHGILRARETLLPSRALRLAEGYPGKDYLNAFVDTQETLRGLAKIWPQYQIYPSAFALGGQIDKTIEAFNHSIRDSHKRDYQELVRRYATYKEFANSIK
jgi:hypothetical protein